METEQLGWVFVKTMLMLGIVLGLIYVLFHYGLGRLLKSQKTGQQIVVKERIAIDAKHAVCMLEVNGEELLVGVSDGQIALLKDMSLNSPPRPVDASTLVREHTAPTRSFRSILSGTYRSSIEDTHVV